MGAATDPRNDTSRGPLRAAAACIVLLVALVHGRTLLGDFGWTFDDARFIVNNPHVTSPSSWTSFFTDMRTTDPLSPTGIVRPLRTLEFALDARLFGLSPTAFRAHTLLWFACGAVGVLLLLREILGDVRSACVGAALWAMHPMQTEVADWVSSRGDAACGALTIFAVWTALRSRACAPPIARRWLAASLGLGALAVLYKETGIVVPLLVVIAWSAVRRDVQGTTMLRRIRDAWPWFAVAAGYLAYRSVVQVGATSHVTAYVPGGSVAGTFATMFRGFGAYLLETVLPVRPAVDWYLPASQSLLDAGAILWFAVHGALLTFGWIRMRRAEPVGAAVLWFYAALLPVVNWPFYLGIPTAERFLHVALGGLALAVGVAVRTHRRLVGPAAFVIACCAVLSFVRAADWKDDTTLWPRTAATVDSPRAHSYLAAELRKDGFARLAAARRMSPGADRERAETDALRVLTDAARHADTSITIWQAIEGTADPRTQVLFEPCVNAANIRVLLGEPYVALRYADEAIRIGEDLAPHPHYNRALALLDLGRGEAAVPSLERALDLGFAAGTASERAEFVALLERAATLCEESGATALARRALRRATAIDTPDAARAVALADALDRRVAERIERLQAGVRDDPRSRGALAIVLAGDGRLAPADEIAGAGALPPESFPGAAAVLWIQSRWFARGTREGFERAAVEATSVATRAPSDATADARFLAARSAEELGDAAAATDAFGWIHLHRREMSGDDDPRVRWTERYLAARDHVDAVPLRRVHAER